MGIMRMKGSREKHPPSHSITPMLLITPIPFSRSAERTHAPCAATGAERVQMLMRINLGSSAAAFTRRLDVTALPATRVDKGAKGAGIFMMIFALVWGGVPTLMLIASIASGKFEPAMLFMLIFSVIR